MVANMSFSLSTVLVVSGEMSGRHEGASDWYAA
jgi:hypothetical protein